MKADGLLVGSNSFLISRRDRIVSLATGTGLPAIYPVREFVDTGGLISYGTNFAAMYRQIGAYAGLILAGAKPADLPVQRPTSFEFVVNLRAARTLGLSLPAALVARADEVID